VFLDYFDVLISKIIFKNKKIYYFNTFINKKYFKMHIPKQPTTTTTITHPPKKQK
jgi:hypothetical protein